MILNESARSETRLLCQNVVTLVFVFVQGCVCFQRCALSPSGYAAVAVLSGRASRQVVVHVALLRPLKELALDEVLDALLDHLGRR
jgi:hypothetical protein